MDPEIASALSFAGGALVSGKIIEKLLGPTADYFGKGVQLWAEKRINNLGNIFANAHHKLGDRIDSPGAVPPRVFAGILNEGSFCDAALATEYLGGVLASSRTEVSRDDRGAALISLVARLSTYQLRLHYILYRVFAEIYGGSNATVSDSASRQTLCTYLPTNVFHDAMDFSEEENHEVIMHHALVGLGREDLLGPNWALGGADLIRKHGYSVPAHGLVIEPSVFGVELFLHAHGRGNLLANMFLSPDTRFDGIQGIAIPKGSRPVRLPSPPWETSHPSA
jgi:hypothetical protein